MYYDKGLHDVISLGGTRMADMLTRLKSLDRPIRTAIIGIGSAGKGLFYQCGITPGIRCVAVADVNMAKAVEAAQAFARPYRVVDEPGGLHDAIRDGLVGVCQDGEMLARCELVDVLIDASSAIADGGRFALAAIEAGKDIVMMNAEADLIFGPYLMRLASKNGTVYTSCDGDQPGCIRRLIDEIQLWGFELVMAGNIKGFLDRYSNPTKIIPEADKRFLDYKMCAGYTDGTKLSVEMALVANAYDLVTTVPGMRGPRAGRLVEIFDLFDFEAIRADGRGVVDYVLGSRPYGGVFVVGYCDSKYQQSMLGWFPSELGRGPFYVFDRSYHIVHIEAMKCVAEAFLDRDSLLQPTYGFRTNVYTYAKQDLRQGQKLDGIGGYTCYGLIENCSDNRAHSGVPICLADDVTLNRDIAKDEKIFLEDIAYDPDRLDYRLYFVAAEQPRQGAG
jgi:predicted homoserine dehydrogenase-like protein